ncbi:transketolase [Helicobacter ailurogastricus]|uniref:Transketolase n=1 Tax=Helicobacter ailurogastricus TaxID=1578720 RepID=A0A0K2X6C3_9HELI|nr:transketolase [Helicobacter ailurogastricus]CRF41133.1 Transketolase [Helicobacter ailurogastricus]CRF41873.1 Transketolase [Helicobacter ailurogastricus]CRF43565.1 Transketolase [Helicobacter ailurogastricus]
MDSALSLKDILTLEKMAKTLRFLCADMVQEANSGHPGVAMGLADVAVVLSQHVRLNPKNPEWLGRDRLIFSGGHASALVYALLHLWGFDVSLEDLKAFRKLHSVTPGHPEFKHTPGVEVTTGPLGQGFANAVGLAMAGKLAQNMLGDAFKHKVYCLCGDGDLQEGISYESASLAGHLGLDDLIVLYDSNAITIEGDTNLAFSENVRLRFEAQGWAVLACDGHDFLDIDKTLNTAKSSDKPTLIIAHTTIGKGALELEGSAKTHGAPLGAEVIGRAKEALKWPSEAFYIPEEVKLHFSLQKGEALESLWAQGLSVEVQEQIAHLQAKDFSQVAYPTFELGQKCATRASNGAILNALSQAYLGFVGGSADLAPSNNTRLKAEGDFLKGQWGRNLHFGIREHAMGAICNGLANYGLFVPFCATFFVFSDYLAPALRLSALMQNQVYYIFTHDSIGVGEDGATHQPIEQLSHLRAIPNFEVYRPMDAHENVLCWQVALKRAKSAAFVLSRQDLEVASTASLEQVQRGGYVLYKSSKEPQISLLSSGSEVLPCLKAAHLLEAEGVGVQVVSVPCFDLLLQQELEYLNTLLVGRVLAVEASRGLEWFKFADEVFGMQSFGKSGRGADLFKHFGFTPENIANKAKALL